MGGETVRAPAGFATPAVAELAGKSRARRKFPANPHVSGDFADGAGRRRACDRRGAREALTLRGKEPTCRLCGERRVSP